MFLKSIELRGFKSFAEKTEIILRNGITTIVGPNGSGKSNISDGVRWVLGEQSVKSLRGGKMEDVIFAGTQFRKALGLAQVSMTLDNSDKELPIDYSDVTVSRRLFRSGESEYYINNTQCRLKDIQELFMDTGIGKEGYSIIGQGKIDAVLSGKPEERRSLLEEAAGIVKFKTRKEEAEKKLQLTQQNLIRLNDILVTLEERIEPLRIDSEKAKEFITLSGDLKEKEINLIVYNIERMQLNISQNEESALRFKRELEVINKELDEHKLLSDNLNCELEKYEKNHAEHQKKYYDFRQQIQEKESEINILNERISNFENSVLRLDENIKEYSIKINDNKSKMDKQKEEIYVLTSEKSEIDKNIIELEKHMEQLTLSVNDIENTVKEIKNEQIELASNISTLTNSISVLKNKKENILSKAEQLKNGCGLYLNSLKTNSLTKEALEEQVKEANSRITYLNSEIRNKKTEMTSINNLIFEEEKKLKALNNTHSKLEANRSILINLDKQYEGYNRSVKYLMQDVEKGKIAGFGGKCCVLGEIISVDKSLETAIEIALGASISNVITDTEEIAKYLIRYLKDNNIGRATFLPLTTVKGRKLSINNDLRNMRGFLGIASELIKYDDKYSAALDFVLGRTVICEDMDTSIAIAKKYDYSFKIVTLSGDVVNPGGSLTGGSVPHKNASIISRKREIDELQVKVQAASDDINNTMKKIEENKKQIKSIDSICLNYTDEVYAANIEMTKIRERINAIVNENIKLQQNIDISNNEIDYLQKDIDNVDKEINSKETELLTSRAKAHEYSDRMLELEDSYKESSDKTKDIRDNLTSMKIKQAKMNEVVSNKMKDLTRFEYETEEYEKKLSSLDGELSSSRKEKEVSEKSIELNKKIIEDLNEKLMNTETIFKEFEFKRINLKKDITENVSKVEEYSKLLNNKEAEIHRIDVVLAKLETELESQYSRLNEDLELTYAEALKYKSPIKSIEQYKGSIDTLKSSIAALGSVNVGAIEEYKEVKEKYTFMESQKNDLLKAIEELNGVIGDMTQKMKVVFRENFNKLRIYFNETFVELFKGGSADLILSDGDELEGNIDITVQPPGKKLQNINLMSGGEKGLSAIALLFAILKMKPTPFCILDEIEAALDDANVIRYAEFLRRFSNNIQFIVITHRKGTMEASDALYGVTMEEKGVSKIISIDLTTRQV